MLTEEEREVTAVLMGMFDVLIMMVIAQLIHL